MESFDRQFSWWFWTSLKYVIAAAVSKNWSTYHGMHHKILQYCHWVSIQYRLSAECIWAASSNPIPVCSQSMKTAIANVLCPVLFSVTPNQTGIIPLKSMGLTTDWSSFAPVKVMELYWYSSAKSLAQNSGSYIELAWQSSAKNMASSPYKPRLILYKMTIVSHRQRIHLKYRRVKKKKEKRREALSQRRRR